MSVNRGKVQQDADRLARLGKVDDAISLYQQLLQGSPRDMNIKSRIGELHFRAGFITGAVKILTEVAEFYESEGFQLKSVAVRKRINEIVPAGSEGEEVRAEPAGKPRPAGGAAVLPFLDPAADTARPRDGGAPSAVESLPGDPLVAKVAEAIDRFRKVDAEHTRVRDRLATIEAKKGGTVAVVYEKVHKDAQVKVVALSHVREACARELTGMRDTLVAERGRVEAALTTLETDLEEVRFLHSIGDFTKDQFVRGEAAKVDEMTSTRLRFGVLGQLAAELELMTAVEPAAVAGPAPAAAAPAAPAAAAAPASAPTLAAAPMAPPTAAAAVKPAPEAAPAAVPAAATVAPVKPVPEATPAAVTPFPELPAAVTPFPESPAAPAWLVADAVTPVEVMPEPAAPAPPAPAAAPVTKTARPVLVVRWKGGRQRDEVFYLASGVSTIGRGSESEILLLEKSISRRHASLRLENGDAYLEDLESANGCQVNGESLRPAEPRKLSDGDVVRLGELEMVYWSMRPRSEG